MKRRGVDVAVETLRHFQLEGVAPATPHTPGGGGPPPSESSRRLGSHPVGSKPGRNEGFLHRTPMSTLRITLPDDLKSIAH